jgi:hypothetical protein
MQLFTRQIFFDLVSATSEATLVRMHSLLATLTINLHLNTPQIFFDLVSATSEATLVRMHAALALARLAAVAEQGLEQDIRDRIFNDAGVVEAIIGVLQAANGDQVRSDVRSGDVRSGVLQAANGDQIRSDVRHVVMYFT